MPGGTLNLIMHWTKYPIQEDGTVLWRRFPCFCPACQHNQWQNCQQKDIVGEVKNVKFK